MIYIGHENIIKNNLLNMDKLNNIYEFEQYLFTFNFYICENCDNFYEVRECFF